MDYRSTIIKKFGPVVWAAQFGISLGNLLAGTASLDEEMLKLIALGNSAQTYACQVNHKA